ncbi:hypothetical protein B0H12DRAFT_1241055, partial [Mycena haematopus]
MDPGFQDLVFSEILLTDHAAPRVPDNCESCETEDARFFCRSCFWPQFLCRVCILKAHARHPLHRVEMVMDKTLKGTTLQSLGLVIQLGHGVDGVCLNPEREGEFTVTASDGVHDVTMNFCGCPGARARGDQLEAGLLSDWSYTSTCSGARDLGRRRQTDCLIIPVSDDEGGDVQASSRAGDVDLLPERHIHRGIDGRMQHDYTLHELPASPTKPVRPSLRPDVPTDMDHADLDGADGIFTSQEEQDEEVVYDFLPKEPRKLRASDDPLRQWVEKKKPQQYLDEIVMLDGRGDYQDDHECIICDACIVRAHADSPLHRIENWTEGRFDRTTLKKLGLRIQLGHAVDDDFVVIDIHQIHEVGVDFCGCETAQPRDVQLLRARWYPATGKSPRTAATFSVLRRYHLTTLESKCSVSEFYNSLSRGTDNTGTARVRDRYDELIRMTRQWRHLQMLKRTGRGHDPSGVEATKAGECAVLCPACPQPGKNLPPNWQDAPEEKRFLYALFLAMDANFRMRRKKVSSEEADPSLGDGWSFFVKLAPYYEYLATNWTTKQERSTCVAHDAVDKPDRESRGTASSGIATVDCARHNMKRPNAVADLQLGERYINMDYIFFIGLAGSAIIQLFVSYDIVCQWFKNIWERMKTFPSEIREHMGKKYYACNVLFSFNLTPCVGMTDGEAPERGWSALNPLATATAEMGPGNRRDTINDAFNDMNHKKIIGLGKWIEARLTDAVPGLITASTELEELEASIRNLGGGEGLEAWKVEMEAWERDTTKTNPFLATIERPTVVNVRREMAEEVESELAGLTVSDEMHPSEMIGMGLQLEELQRNLGFDIAGIGNHPSSEQQASMTERSNKLRRKLHTWMDAQVLFIPHVALMRAEEDRARRTISSTQSQPGIQVQHIALWLPSSIKGRDPCDDELYEYEYRLREAQAHDALDALRKQLLLRTHLYKYKDRFSRGVKANTRLGTKISGVDERIRRISERYRAARRALVGLGSVLKQTQWEATLLPLKPEDVRGMPRALFQDPERKKLLMKKGAEARRQAEAAGKEAKAKMSWIWRSAG